MLYTDRFVRCRRFAPSLRLRDGIRLTSLSIVPSVIISVLLREALGLFTDYMPDDSRTKDDAIHRPAALAACTTQAMVVFTGEDARLEAHRPGAYKSADA
ncbi:hypothetical protein OH77DRAFT_260008 [Trametes cingulata]|nr:hypothetical protein OH77DRAFT_260008 [Trametes cingulata]